MIKFINLHLKFQLTDLFQDQGHIGYFLPLEEKEENLVYKEGPLTLEVIYFVNV